nr:galactose-binding lectin l-1-like [Paramormyrops kingsleyae]
MNIGSWALLLLCVLQLHFGHTQPLPKLTLKDMPVTATNQLKITGIPKLNAKRFSINIGLGEENIALQFDVRFEFHNDRNTTVFSYKQNNSTWTNVVKDEHFPFEQGEEFKVIITFDKDEFLVKIPGNYVKSYPNHFGAEKFMLVRVQGDVRIKSFNIE